MSNGDIGLIEQFYELNSTQYAVINLLKIEPFNFKIYRANEDLSKALLKINDCFLFCNKTDDFILVNVDNIKEKLLLINSKINSKASYFATKVVERHN